jgi:hypothetical protein
MYDLVMEPYLVGFDKKCDGKSCPGWWKKLDARMVEWGLKRDPKSVRHDLDYYTGKERKGLVDKRFIEIGQFLGGNKWMRSLETTALSFSFSAKCAWWRHARLRKVLKVHRMDAEDICYGTMAYVPYMRDVVV